MSVDRAGLLEDMVFLYELALELDVRSTELLDRAHAMGIMVDPTKALTPAQVEELRDAYGKGRARLAQAPAVGGPGAPAAAAADRPVGVTAIAALVLAGLVVVLLIGYVVTNSGSDQVSAGAGDAPGAVDVGGTTTTEPCDSSTGIGVGAIGQDPAAATTTAAAGAEAATTETATTEAAAALPPCDVVGGLSDDEMPSTTFSGDPIDLPRDKREFCRSGLSALEFEGRMAAAADPMSLGPISDVMISGRDQWKSDVVVMTATAPPRLDIAVERYRIVYTNLLDSAEAGASDLELAQRFGTVLRTDLAYYAVQITDAITATCGK